MPAPRFQFTLTDREGESLAWSCDRCGQTVHTGREVPFPDACPRCVRVFALLDAEVRAWVEGVVEQALRRHVEHGTHLPTTY